MTDRELLPCPFCGSSIVAPLVESPNPGDKLGVVGCGVCGASGPSLYEGDELLKRWNGRAASLPLPAELEEIRQRRQNVPKAPWEYLAGGSRRYDIVAGRYREAGEDVVTLLASVPIPANSGKIPLQIAQFFAHAPDDIDRLLAYAAARDARIAELQAQVSGHCERIAAQSELLTQKAGKRGVSADEFG